MPSGSCTGDGAYKAAHDALITLRGEPTPDTLTRLATDLGHDPKPIFDRMNGPEVMSVIQANYTLAEQMEVTGTPAFVLKDMVMRGYAPLETHCATSWPRHELTARLSTCRLSPA